MQIRQSLFFGGLEPSARRRIADDIQAHRAGKPSALAFWIPSSDHDAVLKLIGVLIACALSLLAVITMGFGQLGHAAVIEGAGHVVVYALTMTGLVWVLLMILQLPTALRGPGP